GLIVHRLAALLRRGRSGLLRTTLVSARRWHAPPLAPALLRDVGIKSPGPPQRNREFLWTGAHRARRLNALAAAPRGDISEEFSESPRACLSSCAHRFFQRLDKLRPGQSVPCKLRAQTSPDFRDRLAGMKIRRDRHAKRCGPANDFVRGMRATRG